jgi:hypothetical protein
MFGTKPDIEPAHQDVDPADLIPISVVQLDLDAPGEGWPAYLAARHIEITLDDIGMMSISRDAARQLFTEHRENLVRAREVAARREQQAIEADQRFRAQLPSGLHWTEIPVGVTAGEVWAQAEKDSRPRRRSVLEDALSNQGTVLHSLGPTPDGE